MSVAPIIGATWQERFEQKKQRDALIDQLRALDHQRDALRAAIADASLLCAERPYGVVYGGEEAEAAWLAEQQIKVNRRAERRAWEAPWAGVIPPGPWDEDLDKHLGGPIVWDLGHGYSGRLTRNRDGGWNYYITVPAGHALWGKSYEHQDLPCYFSYSAEEEDGGWTFGHCHDGDGGDVVPKIHYRQYRAENHFSGESDRQLISLPSLEELPFLTAEAVKKQVGRIKDHMMAAVVHEEAPLYDVVGGYKIGTAGDYEVEIEAEMEAAKPRSWSSIVKGH